MSPRFQPIAGYSDNLGVRLLRELADQGVFIFSTDEARLAASRLSIPDNYLNQLLTRLTEGGWLVRLRRGLYAGTGRLPGEVHVHPFAIATSVVSPSAISHWSAMHHHGLTEQVPQIVTAFTPRKVVTPSMRSSQMRGATSKHAWEILGVRYEYMTVKPEHFFGVDEQWVDEHFKVPITDKERTMLEGFISPRMFGGMGEVLSILEEHIDEFDLKKLAEYALRYGKASVIKRLGWALEQFGAPASITMPLAEAPVSGYRVLDPTQRQHGPCEARWMIQNNLAAQGKR